MKEIIIWWKIVLGILFLTLLIDFYTLGLILIPFSLTLLMEGFNINMFNKGDEDERNCDNRKL